MDLVGWVGNEIENGQRDGFGWVVGWVGEKLDEERMQRWFGWVVDGGYQDMETGFMSSWGFSQIRF